MVAQSLPEGVLNQGAGCGGRDRAGTERMRVRRRLLGHPLDAFVLPSCYLGKEKHAFGGHPPRAQPSIRVLASVAQRSHIHMPIWLPRALCQKGRWQAAIPRNCSDAVEKGRPSVPRMWPLESAVQAEGSFAFNRIADLAARFASKPGWIRRPPCSFMHRRAVAGCPQS